MNLKTSPPGRARSSSRQAAPKVHGGAWRVLTASATKGKNKHFLQKPRFLSKQIDISRKTALFASPSLSRHSDTCSNPLKTCHAAQSLPPNTCHNLCEQGCLKASTSCEPHPSWHQPGWEDPGLGLPICGY